jgi:hypothetical protein
MEQVIRSDGRIIRLAPNRHIADTKDCPSIKIKSDGRGFYVHSHYNEIDGFYAVDVTRLYSDRWSYPNEP